MPINQDKSRPDGTYPPSSILRIYKFLKSTNIKNDLFIKSSGYYFVDKCRTGISIKSIGLKSYTVEIFTLNGMSMLKKIFSAYSCCTIPLIAMKSGIYVIKISSLSKIRNIEKPSLIQKIIIY